VGTFQDVEIGEFEEESEDVGNKGGGSEISKISTTSEFPLEFNPPPKNILFVDDVDASQSRG
jgi:hypothetical protein